MRRAQKGFTIIELVVVIAILTILAAVGLPKFIDVNDEANQAHVDAMRGAFTTAVRLVFAQVVANGDRANCDLTNVSGYGDGDVDVNSSCFPVSASSDVASLSTAGHCVEIWDAMMQNPPEVDTAAGPGVVWVASVAATTCTYTYQPDTSKTITYASATGSVS